MYLMLLNDNLLMRDENSIQNFGGETWHANAVRRLRRR
jgi:hypothetical protein